MPFVGYAVAGFVDGLNEQLSIIRRQQHDVVWRNFIHEKFRDLDRPSDVRRRNLVLDLSLRDQAVPLSDVRHVSPRIAEYYAGKTRKTLTRDINSLLEMGLITKDAKGIRPNRETVLAFLPPRVL